MSSIAMGTTRPPEVIIQDPSRVLRFARYQKERSRHCPELEQAYPILRYLFSLSFRTFAVWQYYFCIDVFILGFTSLRLALALVFSPSSALPLLSLDFHAMSNLNTIRLDLWMLLGTPLHDPLTSVRQLQSLVGLGFAIGHDSAGDLKTGYGGHPQGSRPTHGLSGY